MQGNLARPDDVVDAAQLDLERLLEYVRIGPRFSNVVLQTLLVCIKKVPQKGKLVILATAASAAILERLLRV